MANKKNNKNNYSSNPSKGNAGKNNKPTNNKPANNKSKNTRKEEVVTPVTEDEADDIRVTVDLDDGSSVECAILTILEVDGQDYIALLPMDKNDQPNEAGEVLLYRYYEDAEGIPSLDNITDDDEFEAVFDAFDEWQDDQLFDSMPD